MPALAPAFVGGAVMLCARRVGAVLASLAGSLGYLAAHVALLGLPELSPVAAVERLPYVLLGIGVVVALCGARTSALADAALLSACLGASWWLIESARANELAGTPGVLVLGGLALVGFGTSQLLGAVSRAGEAWVAPLLVAVLALALAPALIMGRSGSLAQLAGALCAASSAAAVLCWRGSSKEEGMMMARGVAPALSLLAVCGALYAYLDPWAAACLALAPLLSGFGLRKDEEWSLSRGFIASSLCALLGLWLAYQGMPAPSPYDY